MSTNNNNNNNNTNDNGWASWAWEWGKYFAYEAAIFAGTFLLSSMVVNWIKSSNPSLTAEQCDNLHKLLTKAVTDYRRGLDVEYTIRSILTLICPDDVDISNVIISILSGVELNTTQEQTREDRQLPEDLELSTMKVEDEFSDVLITQFGLDEQKVLLLPIELRESLLNILKTNPTCPLTLDTIIDETTGHVRPGITALFQYVDHKPHTFLFDSESISGWVEQHQNVNPVTRQPVNRKEYFVLTESE